LNFYITAINNLDPVLRIPTLQSSTNHSSLLFDTELTFTPQYVDGQEEPRWQNANVNSLVKILLTVQPFVSRDVQFCTEQTQYIIDRLPSSLKWKNTFSSYAKILSILKIKVFNVSWIFQVTLFFYHIETLKRRPFLVLPSRPVFLGISRHPKQKEFFNSCEGLLRAGLTGHSHPSPF
jgi:hypothetical protein